MLLTLIQTSQNRKRELARFVEALNQQEDVDFSQLQLIFVDQEDNKSAFEQLNTAIKALLASFADSPPERTQFVAKLL